MDILFLSKTIPYGRKLPEDIQYHILTFIPKPSEMIARNFIEEFAKFGDLIFDIDRRRPYYRNDHGEYGHITHDIEDDYENYETWTIKKWYKRYFDHLKDEIDRKELKQLRIDFDNFEIKYERFDTSLKQIRIDLNKTKLEIDDCSKRVENCSKRIDAQGEKIKEILIESDLTIAKLESAIVDR